SKLHAGSHPKDATAFAIDCGTVANQARALANKPRAISIEGIDAAPNVRAIATHEGATGAVDTGTVSVEAGNVAGQIGGIAIQTATEPRQFCRISPQLRWITPQWPMAPIGAWEWLGPFEIWRDVVERIEVAQGRHAKAPDNACSDTGACA
ncbi:MAG: hypothetical protein KDD84_05705, partial [Caldilineaceae bacterium]|nr:hypothetical protein [Caldilineaceae bacterium]